MEINRGDNFAFPLLRQKRAVKPGKGHYKEGQGFYFIFIIENPEVHIALQDSMGRFS